MEKTTFKRATVEDIELINAMAKEVFYDTYSSILSSEQLEYMFTMMYSYESLREQMEVKCSQYFIGYKVDTPCRYLSVMPLFEGGYHLDKIYVMPQFQKCGLGREMIEYAKGYVREVSTSFPSHLSLNVNRNNIAVGFYHAMGFVIARSGDFDIGGGYFMNDHIMEIEVNG